METPYPQGGYYPAVNSYNGVTTGYVAQYPVYVQTQTTTNVPAPSKKITPMYIAPPTMQRVQPNTFVQNPVTQVATYQTF